MSLAEDYINGHFFGFSKVTVKQISDLIFCGIIKHDIAFAVWKEYINNRWCFFVSDFNTVNLSNSDYEKIFNYVRQLDHYLSVSEICSDIYTLHQIKHAFTRQAINHLHHVNVVKVIRNDKTKCYLYKSAFL